jgi:hypothetical protein
MKIYIPAFLLMALSCCFFSCTGPRNIYSSSPFISPVQMEKGTTAIEVNYFSHSRNQNSDDSFQKNQDNSFDLIFYHMLKERTVLFAFADVKNEHDLFHDNIALANDPGFNAGFDSSNVFGKRHTVGAGMEFFFKDHGKTTTSFAASVGLHRFSLNESGLFGNAPYDRFFRLNQLSLSLQQNLLFKISNNLKIACVTRLTILNNFKATTNYSSEEKNTTGLRDQRVNIFICLPGLYADYKPFKKNPVYVNGQFFNDLSLWDHTFAKYELGRVYIKGTGASTGLRYIF